MADTRQFAIGNQLDIEQLLIEAQHRWLRPAEICEILWNYQKFGLAPEPPNTPPSGSLFLFDQKVLRNFRKDGHKWRKQKDGKTVKETHERLKAGSTDELHCYYALGEENENFQRRSYWMLEEELLHIVLVHYREVKPPHAQPNMQNDLHVHRSNPGCGHLLKSDSENNLTTERKLFYNSARNQYWCDGSTEEGLKKIDSFSHWMSKELGDVKESKMQSSSGAYWETVESENGVHDSSSVNHKANLDSYMLSPSLSQDQLYSIIDFSPNWAHVGSEVKVLITGRVLMSQKEAENCKWSCMFGELEVPAEIVVGGVLRCHTPSQKIGRVPFYVTCSNRLACSEVREFEYRANHIQHVDTTDKYGDVTSECLRMRFGKLLCLSVSTPNGDPGNLSDISERKSKINSLLKEESDSWDQMLKLTSSEKFSPEVQEKLLQKLLKEKLHAWLLQKAAEGGKGPSVLDKHGQGVLHFAAALGYDWALESTVVAGVNINFRDVNGWTALHWAAYCGRECTVASLISLGAAPGALSDPTPKYPSGRTPADLASSIGHKGIAGYLAESDLSSPLSVINLNKQDNDVTEINGAKVVQTISQRSPTPISDGDLPYGLSLKDSLDAVRNATQVAARIHQLFRAQSFQKKQLKHYADDTFGISDERALSLVAVKSHKPGHHNEPVHAAAIRIQNKFRSWKGRKDFLIIRQQIIKIQAHTRGHLVRKSYKKIIWSVGILEKVILRWRRKGSSLCGYKSEALAEGSTSMLDTSSKGDDFDFLKEGRKQKEERLQKALTRVMSMVRYPEARDQYRRLQDVVIEIQETKAMALNNSEKTAVFNDDLVDTDTLLSNLAFMPMKDHDSQSWEDFVEDCAQGVGSQHFHPPSSSTQPETLKQGHEILGELYTKSFGEQKELGSHLSIQGELQGNSTNVNCIKVTEGTTPYLQETELITPISDVEGSQSSYFHPKSYQMPSQTTDMTILNSAQASVYKGAESGAFVVDFMSQFLVLL